MQDAGLNQYQICGIFLSPDSENVAILTLNYYPVANSPFPSPRDKTFSASPIFLLLCLSLGQICLRRWLCFRIRIS